MGAAEVHRSLGALARLVEEARRDPARAEGVRGGTLHLDGLAGPSSGVAPVWRDLRVLAVVRHHLGAEAVLGDAAYRAPLPGHGGQTLHTDWTGPVAPGDWRVANLLVALVPFAGDDGATRVVPGTHRAPDPRFRPKAPTDRHPQEQRLRGPAGTGFVFSGHVLHSGTTNRSSTPRHALLVTYGRRLAA